MASDADLRRWAAETGWARKTGNTVSNRGAVSHALRSAYAAAHNGEPEPGPAYPDGMTDDDFLAEADTPDDDLEDMTESVPRPVTPKASSSTIPTKLSGAFRRGKSSASKSKAKPKRPRVKLDDLITSIWAVSSTVARPVPPLRRTLALQSVIAGPILDPVIKDTFIDPLLQVVARHYQAGEATAALVAPNLGIAAAAIHQAQAAKAGTDPNPVVMQACVEMTRYGLRSMMKLGGDAFAAKLAQEQADEEKYGANIDMILEWIFSAPADPATEEANAAHAANIFAGHPEPAPA